MVSFSPSTQMTDYYHKTGLDSPIPHSSTFVIILPFLIWCYVTYIFKSRSSGLWCHVVLWEGANSLEDPAASILGLVSYLNNTQCHNPEDLNF